MPRPLLLLSGALVLSSCHASRLPPALPAAQLQLIRGAELPYRIGVERDRLPAYSRGLIQSLRRTGLFREVADLDSLSAAPDLIARVERRISGCAEVPLWTALTLGLVPTFCEEHYGTVFSLSSPDAGDRETIALEGKGPSVLGWLGGLLSTLPTWSSKSVKNTQRYHEHLALVLVQHAAQIHRVAARRPR